MLIVGRLKCYWLAVWMARIQFPATQKTGPGTAVFTLRTPEKYHNYINKCLMDLTEVREECVDWIQLAQVRVQ
jgi:hypothetical protein